MLEPYDLLENVLTDIEKWVREDVNEYDLAAKYSMSQGYLRRLFKFAFERPLGSYIRSRKLAASIEELLHTGSNILDIALEYGFGYEQTYIKSFKREFGITPGSLRKTGQIVEITPPLHLFDSNRLAGDVFFGPDIVMIPQFHVVGKRHQIRCRDERALVIDSINEFNSMKDQIPNIKNHHVLINISTEAAEDSEDADYWNFMPSVQVKNLNAVPSGFDSFTFPSALCARFRIVGHQHDMGVNKLAADAMFRAINDFMDDKNQKYFLERKKINIDRFDPWSPEGFYSYWEWFAPVRIKTKDDVPEYAPGIIKTYKQELPALRFIGKKYTMEDLSWKEILCNLDNCCSDRHFETIEKQSDRDLRTLYEGGNAHISLIKNNGTKAFEYYLGLFMPPGTTVPQGYEKLDFPKSTVAVCRVYGKRDCIVNREAECRKRLTEDGIELRNQGLFFQRFNWRDFFKEDKYGKRILEYCYCSV